MRKPDDRVFWLIVLPLLLKLLSLNLYGIGRMPSPAKSPDNGGR